MTRFEQQPKPTDRPDHDKSAKTIVGVAVALLLAAGLIYEMKRPSPNIAAASDRPTMSQNAPDNTHMPERL
jgi:hypothetical protein